MKPTTHNQIVKDPMVFAGLPTNKVREKPGILNEADVIELSELIRSYYTFLPPMFHKIKTRKREITTPRQMMHYFLKRFSRFTLKQIGGFTGGHDHSTVLNSIQVINDLVATEKDFRKRLTYLEQRVKEHFMLTELTPNLKEEIHGH